MDEPAVTVAVSNGNASESIFAQYTICIIQLLVGYGSWFPFCIFYFPLNFNKICSLEIQQNVCACVYSPPGKKCSPCGNSIKYIYISVSIVFFYGKMFIKSFCFQHQMYFKSLKLNKALTLLRRIFMENSRQHCSQHGQDRYLRSFRCITANVSEINLW